MPQDDDGIARQSVPATDEGAGEIIRKGLKAVLAPLVMAFGEGVVGLIPILTPYVVKKFSTYKTETWTCEMLKFSCTLADRDHNDELNIVTVVISGLALLSLFPLGKFGRKMRFTVATYLIALGALLLIILASILYAIAAQGTAADNAYVSGFLLALSLLVSFYLAAEEAWLEAIQGS